VLDIWRKGGASLLRDHLISERSAGRREVRYRQWMREVEPGLLQAITVDAELMDRGPEFSVVVPVFNTDPAMLQTCIESVLSQTYRKWHLILVDDASSRPETCKVLGSLKAQDDRVVVTHRSKRGGISAATNDGLAAARGDYIAFLDHDDALSPYALAAMARRIVESDDVDVLYSDEDKLDERGSRHTPVFKPALSPHHLFTSNYCCHLLVVRASLMRELRGLQSQFDGAQDYDLVLRCLERTDRFAHVPLVLYHWRTHSESTSGSGRAKPHASEAGRRALAESMRRHGLECRVEHSPFLLSYRVRPAGSGDDQVEVVRTRSDGSVCEHDWTVASEQHSSRWILFLAQGVADITAGQVETLVAAAKLPHAGPVGAVVVDPQGCIEDAGWFIDESGEVRGRYHGCVASHPGAGWALRLPRNVSFVGPCCLLVDRSRAQRVLSQPAGTVPWHINLARAMRADGRFAQVLGDVQVRCEHGRLYVQPPRLNPGEWDGLMNHHLAYVEPEYSPQAQSRHSGYRDPNGEVEEDRCAASSV
jgi:hypothetical protein